MQGKDEQNDACLEMNYSDRQGEGGNRNEDEEEYELHTPHELGSLSHRSCYALASCSSFFRYSEMYLLYFWDVTKMFDLTHSCMQAFESGTASGDGGAGVPSLFGMPNDNDFGNHIDDASSSSTRTSVSKKSGPKEIAEESKQMCHCR